MGVKAREDEEEEEAEKRQRVLRNNGAAMRAWTSERGVCPAAMEINDRIYRLVARSVFLDVAVKRRRGEKKTRSLIS